MIIFNYIFIKDTRNNIVYISKSSTEKVRIPNLKKNGVQKCHERVSNGRKNVDKMTLHENTPDKIN